MTVSEREGGREGIEETTNKSPFFSEGVGTCVVVQGMGGGDSW